MRSDVTIEAPLLPSTDTSLLSGTLDLEFEIDTDNDAVSAVTALDSNITGTQVTFKRSFFGLGYDVSSSETLGIDIFTPIPSGSVDSVIGDYDASDHQFVIDEGTLAGSANLGSPSVIDIDFAATPFGSANAGTGNISVALQSSTSSTKTYNVVMLYPVNTSTPLDVGGTAIDVLINGTVKLVGTITVPLLTEFELWLQDNSLPTSSFEELNQFGLALGIQWALGLNANTSPQSAMPQFDNVSPTSTVYTIDLPVGGSAGELTILYAADLGQPFTSLDTLSVSVGNSIPAGTAGAVTVTLPNSGQGFIKLSATEP